MKEINEERLLRINQLATSFMNANPTQLQNFEVDDLVNEAVCALLEGYQGLKIDGDLSFAVSKAAQRLSGVECKEVTNVDGVYVKADFSSNHHEQELELEDWIETILDSDEQWLVRNLSDGYSQKDLAAMAGVSTSTISEKVKELRTKMVKGGFNVN